MTRSKKPLWWWLCINLVKWLWMTICTKLLCWWLCSIIYQPLCTINKYFVQLNQCSHVQAEDIGLAALYCTAWEGGCWMTSTYIYWLTVCCCLVTFLFKNSWLSKIFSLMVLRGLLGFAHLGCELIACCNMFQSADICVMLTAWCCIGW